MIELVFKMRSKMMLSWFGNAEWVKVFFKISGKLWHKKSCSLLRGKMGV